MAFNAIAKKTGRPVVVEKKRSDPEPINIVTAGHEFAIKFSELPKPQIGEKEIHDIIIRLTGLPFYVKMSLKKKQWNKLMKAVEAIEGSWIAAGRGSIQRIDGRMVYLENVGFQVFERKPKVEPE